MRISRTELKNKYGIDLPTGKYRINVDNGSYVINTVKDDTDGCILVGQNKVKGQVINSRDTFRRLYPRLLAAKINGEKITIEVV